MQEQITPVAPSERVLSIDVMRGAALAGVLLVNLLGAFRVPLSAHILGSDEPLGWGGARVLALLQSLIEFKALTLFSFLFGVGVAIQAGSVVKPERRRFLVRRFGVLFAIGAVHMLFVWNGDILALYAMCGLAVIPLLGLPEYVLIVLGLGLIAWPNIAPFPMAFPTPSTLKALTAGALHAYRDGTWRELFVFRLRETRLLIVPLLILSWPRTVGLMLWGIAAWRKGWMIRSTRLWRWAAILGAAVGIAGQELRIEEAGNLGLACAYGATLLLVKPRARWIAAAGQMALTNYLAQSVIFSFLFYSYGFQLFGRVGIVATLAGGVLVYCLQLALSQWWLKRFWFGPCEWLWRSASYMRWQPFVRAEGLSVSRAELRFLLVAVFLVAIPSVHLGTPMLLARAGPHWGWRNGGPGAVNVLGMAPILLGAWLLIWIASTMLMETKRLPSRVRLGLRPAYLLQTGPYAWSRHPMYVAESFLWIGIIVLFGSPVAMAVFVGMALALDRWIVRREERALDEQFGEEYRAYRARVSRIPRFWRMGRKD